MMTSISQECEDYINQQIEAFAESIDKPIFLQIKDILNKYFGEENNQIIKPTVEDAKKLIRGNWDNFTMQTIRGMDDTWKMKLWANLKVYIKIDNVTITNGNMSHSIKDLWIRFSVGQRGQVSGLQGLRSSMTYEEAKVGYMHSHLPARPMTSGLPPSFEHFCLGSGEINQVISFLHDAFDPINFTLFCLHLKNFIEWESIDGVPHIFMEDIGSGRNRRSFDRESSSRRPTELGSDPVHKVVELIKDYIASTVPIDTLRTMLDPFILNDQVTITQTEELEIRLGDIIRVLPESQWRTMSIRRTDCLAKKDNDGSYIHLETRTVNTVVQEPTRHLFEFKGKPIFLKIEGLQELLTNNVNLNNNVYANPQISREFINSFSTDFAEVCYRNQKAIKTHSLKNLLQTTGSNLLAMR